MIKNIVFDVGQVLMSYTPENYLKNLGFSEKTVQTLRKAIFESTMWEAGDRGIISTEEIWEGFRKNAPGLKKEVQTVYDNLGDVVELMPYAEDWVKTLKEQGYHLYILSNYAEHTYQLSSHKMKFLPYIDPRRRSYEKFGRAYDAFRLALALFVLILQGVTLYAAFYPDGLDVSRIIAACVGALLCVAGNYMPKFRHNYFCGIRTPWTLASETCWRRTHRFAGPLWFWGGLALAAGSFFLSGRWLAAATAALGAVLVVPAYLYSYFIYKSSGED